MITPTTAFSSGTPSTTASLVGIDPGETASHLIAVKVVAVLYGIVWEVHVGHE